MIDDAITEGLDFQIRGHKVAAPTSKPLRYLRTGFFFLLSRLPGMRLYARYGAPRHLRREEVTVPLATLPPGLAGLRIGLLTDLHFEPNRPLALLERGVKLLNAATPDLILLGGDYTNLQTKDFARPVSLLARLRAPLGVFAVLGNHDYWAGGDYIAASLARAGISVLRNRAVCMTTAAGCHWWIVGVDSLSRQHDALDEAFAPVPPGDFRLLLAHEPEIAFRARQSALRVDLQLSGHTHGGQVVLPGIGAPLLPHYGRHFVRGLHHDPAVYTSRGVGGVPPYVRINAAPEVSVLTLVQAPCDRQACDDRQRQRPPVIVKE